LKLTIEQSPDIIDDEIIIRCNTVSDRLKTLIEDIRLYTFSIVGIKDGRSYSVGLEDIFYIESVDEHIFIYRQNDVLECRLKLYELEEKLNGTNFLRISKSCILNLNHLESVSPQFDGRFEALLKNGEMVIINRHYVKAFKEKFGV